MLSKVHHNANILVENFIELMKSNKNGMNRKAYIKIRKWLNLMIEHIISLKSEQKINRDSANWQQSFKHFNKY